MKVAFQIHKLDCRGTFNAMFNYAKYSNLVPFTPVFFLYRPLYDPEKDIIPFLKLCKSFEVYFYANEKEFINLINNNKIDYTYVIKYGRKNDDCELYIISPVKQIVHCVYDMSEPHGDFYVGVSETVAKKFGKDDYIPHMIGLKKGNLKDNLRKVLNIPESAIVFGRHGGGDTFDIPFVKSVISRVITSHEVSRETYFIFMNTGKTPIDIESVNTSRSDVRVIFIPPTVDEWEKNRFINTCDAMLHAQTLGETFGISIGEFSVNEKVIITYGGNVWHDHYKTILGENAIYYTNAEELYNILINYDIIVAKQLRVGYTDDKKSVGKNCYTEYTPCKVMEQWKNVLKMR
jgi:hypothetical protein